MMILMFRDHCQFSKQLLSCVSSSQALRHCSRVSLSVASQDCLFDQWDRAERASIKWPSAAIITSWLASCRWPFSAQASPPAAPPWPWSGPSPPTCRGPPWCWRSATNNLMGELINDWSPQMLSPQGLIHTIPRLWIINIYALHFFLFTLFSPVNII